ncbi:TetR/AcrR family transcriptional regulator [Sporolactobacillus shoreicorticis]|uniref:TetR/AcrR family transcriptional regulator n=1 Tax=Sporolactobacillus shoreicorticis TaxID=1923877 RepID=A0ABW5S2K2_9BACL|nr:TetR/AcrR family transcriptional regulator [Sporolactobacillus shoreicorticis]MCO7127854.1 TetR/AcrR family transcriptional regulator [Sporolactobacillus shoreicorticis]
MPSDTFNHLNSAKKSIIFSALVQEFSQHPISEAQVARIIKSAGISRGAFYKYFDDMIDSYQYVYREVLSGIHGGLIEELYKNPQDTLLAFYKYTADFTRQLAESDYRDFYALHWQINQYYLKRRNQSDDNFNRFLPQMNLTIGRLTISDQQKVVPIVEFLMNVSHHTIQNVLAGQEVEASLAKFNVLITVIKDGLVKGENHVSGD